MERLSTTGAVKGEDDSGVVLMKFSLNYFARQGVNEFAAYSGRSTLYLAAMVDDSWMTDIGAAPLLCPIARNILSWSTRPAMLGWRHDRLVFMSGS